MPITEVVFYKDRTGAAPVLDWLDELKASDKKGWTNCVARIERLREAGHELRRPEADFLRDGVHELRAKHGRLQYRILYFFHGRNVAVLAHGIVKREAAVSPVDIERALNRKALFLQNPPLHTFRQEKKYGN
jgi:phage-related protein